MKINSSIPQPQATVAQNPAEDRNSPLWQAAQGMEANFIREMMKAMRNTVDESEETKNNRGVQIFRSMLDGEYADSAAKQGLGIAEVIVKQMLENSQNSVGRNVSVRNLNERDLIGK